eukprot:tig00001406_g8593.t1
MAKPRKSGGGVHSAGASSSLPPPSPAKSDGAPRSTPPPLFSSKPQREHPHASMKHMQTLLFLIALLAVDRGPLYVYTNEPLLNSWLYFLGNIQFDIFLQNRENPSPMEFNALRAAARTLRFRADSPHGAADERWFASIKLAEIHERFLVDERLAVLYYLLSTELAPERPEAWFFLGQHFRLQNRYEEAYPFLRRASSLPTPDQPFFQWDLLYACLVHVDLARVAVGMANLSLHEWRAVKAGLAKARPAPAPPPPRPRSAAEHSGASAAAAADGGAQARPRCPDGFRPEVDGLARFADERIAALVAETKAPPSDFRPTVQGFLELLEGRAGELKRVLSGQIVDRRGSGGSSRYVLVDHWTPLAAHLEAWRALHAQGSTDCAHFRPVAAEYLSFVSAYESELARLVPDRELYSAWHSFNTQFNKLCS